MILATLVVTAASVKTPILTYHDIIPSRNKNSVWFDCTVQEFKDQISWMRKQGAVFVSLDQVYQSFKSKKPLPKNAVAITFADNYVGFYKYALPIIVKEKIPVTQFVHTGFVGAQTGRPKMDWSQLSKCIKTGLVKVGSQTVTHPADITKMPKGQMIRELYQSAENIGHDLGHAAVYFAYPNGKFNRAVAKEVEKAGYRMAFTEECEPLESAPNLFLVPRYVHTKMKQAFRDCKD